MQSNDHRENSDISRKLAAILFADVVGYSKMMHDDEVKALDTLTRFQAVLEEEVDKVGGKIVKNYGDGSLCVFNSAVQALQCAKAIQIGFFSEPKVPVRIGIHTGDIVEKNNDVYGDGVNIAARLETIGQPGSVLFSKSIFDKVRNHKEFKITSYGRVELKNIEEAVSVYALSNDGFTVPKLKELVTPYSKPLDSPGSRLFKRSFPYIILVLGLLGMKFWNDVTNKISVIDKSIAVLPFHNESNDPSNDYFCNGIMEDILTQLQKIGDLKVISRSSAMPYKDTPKPIREVASELKVAYVLEGSVRRSGEQVLVTAQLIDGKSESQVWADRFDEKLTAQNIFEIQGIIADNIADRLESEITSEDEPAQVQGPTDNLEAYDNYLRGLYFYNDRFGKSEEYISNAIRFFENAIRLDSNFAKAHLRLAHSHRYMYWVNIDGSKERADLAEQYFLSSNGLDPNDPDIMEGQGWYQYHINSDFETAKDIFNSLHNKYPNRSTPLNALGVINGRLGNWKEAEENFEESIDLDPSYVNTYLNFFYNLIAQRKFVQAKNYLDNMLNLSPANETGHKEMCLLIIRVSGDVAKALEYYESSGLQDPNFYRKLKIANRSFDELLQNEPDLATTTDMDELYHYALIHYFTNDMRSAREYANKAISLLNPYVQNAPKDYMMVSKLGIMYAIIGDERRSLEQVNRATSERSIEKDAIQGPELQYEKARVLGILQKDDEAIAILRDLMGIQCRLTSETLKVSPFWDNLRSKSEFKDLLAFQREVDPAL